tara:strand:- start:506 stop:802 length:297 start_codon:yes stop_codon:yes gene_type:complete
MSEDLKILEFNGIVNFSARITDNKKLLKEVPTLEVLAKLGQSLGRGCRCNLRKRRRNADESYKNILNYLSEKDVLIIKEALNASKIIFKLNNLTILDI